LAMYSLVKKSICWSDTGVIEY